MTGLGKLFKLFLSVFLSFQLGNIRHIRKVSFLHHAGRVRGHNGELCDERWGDDNNSSWGKERSLLKWHNGAFVPWGLFAQRFNRSLVAELAEPELVLKVVLLLSFCLSSPCLHTVTSASSWMYSWGFFWEGFDWRWCLVNGCSRFPVCDLGVFGACDRTWLCNGGLCSYNEKKMRMWFFFFFLSEQSAGCVSRQDRQTYSSPFLNGY